MKIINWSDEVSKIESSFMDDLKALLQIPSVYNPDESTPETPFGKDVNRALALFLQFAKRDGFDTKEIDHKAGRISYGDGESIIGALGHIDVMPAGENWQVPPFDLTEENGKLIGRGILDDKGPLLACYYGLKILQSLNLTTKNTIHLIIGTDEENQWRCMARYFQSEPVPIAGFSPDSVFPLVHAEKGILHVDLSFATQPKLGDHLLSFYAGESYNSVPDKATIILACDTSAIQPSVDHAMPCTVESRHENNTIRITQEGRSAHAMNPQLGFNAATHAAVQLIPVIMRNKVPPILTFLADFAHEDFYGEKLGIAVSDDEMGPLTVNVGRVRWDPLEGGTVSLDIRYPRNTSASEIMDKLAKLPLPFTLTKKIGNGVQALPHYVPKKDPFVQTLASIYHQQTGLDATPLALGGVTYAKTFENCVAFGPLFPGREETAHCPNEYLYKEDLFKAIAIYAQALYELGNLDF